MDETVEVIGRSAGRIRQRLGAGSLLGIRDGRSWRIPRFQFGNGAVVELAAEVHQMP